TLIFWGQGDIFFTPAGGEANLRDLPDAELIRLDSGHFAVEDNLDLIADTIGRFYDARVGGPIRWPAASLQHVGCEGRDTGPAGPTVWGIVSNSLGWRRPDSKPSVAGRSRHHVTGMSRMTSQHYASDGATRLAYIRGAPLAENATRQWPQMGEIVRTRQ